MRAGPDGLYRALGGPWFLSFLALFIGDKLLSFPCEGEGVGQRASTKVARGWARAWSQTVSKGCQTHGGVDLRTSVPTGAS